MKKKRMKIKADKMPSKKAGPQGPVSKGGYDAVSEKHKPEVSFVLGTKTNKSPKIRGLTPKAKSQRAKK